jgi:cytochrome bd-type quinol oxidase subunit 2
MANLQKKTRGKKKAPILAFTRTNYLMFAAAVLIIVVGYIALSKGPADSFSSLTLAPILLFIGYLVLVPISIFWRPRKQKEQP